MTISPCDLLPILNHKTEIQEALRTHQTIVIAGDTGSGKTTQLPQFCLELEQNNARLIGCTPPRRVAAVSVAEQVSEEVQEKGESSGIVGYKIRFHDNTSAETRIKFMTNVAETSITVPGICYVVDSGLARISQYNVRAKTISLPIKLFSME